MYRRLALTLLVAISLLIPAGVAVFAIDRASSSASVSSLEGHWKSTVSSTNASRMEADVHNNTIIIMWYTNDTSSLYWKGSFPQPSSVHDGVKVTSAGDVALMRQYLMASRSSSKDFTYNDGKLEFTFTIMGVSRIISLER